MSHLPVAKEGLVFIVPALAISLLLFGFGHPVPGVLVLLPCLFFVYFFRNPVRTSPDRHGELISPADGKVMAVEDIHEDEFLHDTVRRICIFMGLADVHVNRAPTDGNVTRVEHREGKYRLAFKLEIDKENERNYIMYSEGHDRFLLVQIAGFLARRIICYVKEQDILRKGHPVGLIAFGSRVDVYMPRTYEPMVAVGQRVKSGLTPLARKEVP